MNKDLEKALREGYAHHRGHRHGWQGFFDVQHKNRFGDIVWENPYAENTLCNEGEQNMLECYLQAQNCASNYYLRLFSGSITEQNDINDIDGNEVVGSGYSAYTLARSTGGWTSVALIFGSGSDHTDTCGAVTASTITLGASAVATDDYYKYATIYMSNGTGIRQSRVITSYTSGKVATLDRDWTTNPTSGDTYIVYADYIATSAVATFSASGTWTAATKVAQTTSTDDSGLLISYADLSQSRTLQTGESLQVTYRVKLS